MAEGKLCVCPQCGKKYRLREGFDAKSFSCKACGATVWVEGKPPAPGSAPAGRRRGATRRGARGAAKAGAAAPARRGRRGRGREEAPPDEEGHGRYARGRYGKKSSGAQMALALVGVVGVVAVGIVLMLSQKDKDEKKTTQIPTASRDLDETGSGDASDTTPSGSGVTPSAPTPSGTGPSQPSIGDDDGGIEDTQPPESDDSSSSGGSGSSRPPRKLDGDSGSKKRVVSRWAPPADIPHLESTPPEQRQQIDQLIATMMDPMAGRDSNDAKAKLVAIGKPAFPRILGAMAKLRDTITDVDSDEERLLESSLMLADLALREMDGYLESFSKGLLRPGTDKKYIEYILKLHYKRWMQTLKDMPEMPGPYDPSKDYAGDEAPEEQDG